MKALANPLRPHLLTSDVAGLGKTLEIGVLLGELIRRGRGERILVVTPAPVLEQFQHEMWTRFSLPLVRLDSEGIARIERKIPAGRNPFTFVRQGSWRDGAGSGERDEPGPRVRRHGQYRTAHVLRVPDAHGFCTGCHLDAIATLGAVAALEPCEFLSGRRCLSVVHRSPSNFSMNLMDSRGLRACDRIIP